MTQFDIQYRNVAEDILTNGKEHLTRAIDPVTGKQLKAKKLFKRSFLFDLQEEFPILTTKRMPKSKTHPENGFLFASELKWIYVDGSNDVSILQSYGNHVWDEWAIKEGKWAGTIGPAYGWQARKQMAPLVVNGTVLTQEDGSPLWAEYDQVAELIKGLKEDPFGRRHVIDLWSVPHLHEMGLMPCAFKTIWDVDPDGYLNCHLIQRSGDFFLGVPFNVSQYAMFVHMVANAVGLKPGMLAHDITNVHIYENHYDQIEKQLERKPKDCKPTLWVNPDVKNFDDYTLQDIRVDDYDSHPGIKGAVAV
jgi:thymidylate synthase